MSQRIADEFPSVVTEIRGLGLLLGLKCKVANTKLSAALRDEKLLTVTAGENVIRILPPLNVSDDEIRMALGRIRAGAESLAAVPAAAAG